VRGSAITLPYRPPFAWEHFLRFLRARSITGVELYDATSYTRTLRIDDTAGWLRVENNPSQSQLVITLSPSLHNRQRQLIEQVTRMFDRDVDPGEIANHLRTDSRLTALVDNEPGLRLPGTGDPFELAMRGILGQQITVAAAHTLCGRVVARYAEPISDAPNGLTHLPVTPAALARAAPEDVASLGMPQTRARTLVLLARAVVAHDVTLEHGRDPLEVMTELRHIPGIGPWTAEYIAMRALSWRDAFPAADLGIRNALGGVSAREALRIAEPWRPYRAYAVIHLWNSLATKRQNA
jgi:AraC family transcriptional regulator of adaptative response / DNA-3-methyladenine glycosylase II